MASFQECQQSNLSIKTGLKSLCKHAVEHGATVKDAAAEIVRACDYFLEATETADEDSFDVDEAINQIEQHIFNVGNKIEGVALKGFMRSLEVGDGGQENMLLEIRRIINFEKRRWSEEINEVPEVNGDEGAHFAPGSSWGNLVILG